MSLLKLSAALVASANLTEMAMARTEPGMTMIEKDDLRDLIYPWDGRWPMLQTSLNYHIRGVMKGDTLVFGESTMSDQYGNPVPGPVERIPIEVYFDMKVWGT